jgi:hypothetical protein
MSKYFDCWDISTFDEDLIDLLRAHQKLIVSYFEREREIYLTHDISVGRSRLLGRRDNQFKRSFNELMFCIRALLRAKTMRGFHYCRLTDREVSIMRSNSIILSDTKFMRLRLSKIVDEGQMTSQIAERLLAESPLMNGQEEVRAGRFWMVGSPRAVDDWGVKELLENWGGEVVYMFVLDQEIFANRLRSIGRPRIIEVAAPLRLCSDYHPYAERVIASFANSVGCSIRDEGIDFWSGEALPPSAILKIHTEGEPAFQSMARGYPASFSDSNVEL